MVVRFVHGAPDEIKRSRPFVASVLVAVTPAVAASARQTARRDVSARRISKSTTAPMKATKMLHRFKPVTP